MSATDYGWPREWAPGHATTKGKRKERGKTLVLGSLSHPAYVAVLVLKVFEAKGSREKQGIGIGLEG
jgi:hypothetical protein